MTFADPIGSTITIGRQCKLNINGKTICFARAVPKSTREIVTNQDNAICGDIDPDISRAQKGRQMVAWSFYFDITWPTLEVVLPLLGVSGGAVGPWSLGATDLLSLFPVMIDMVGEVHDIGNAFCTGWSIRGTKGGRPIQMQMDIAGETEEPGTFVVDEIDFGDEYAFTHASTTIENELTADEARDFDRFLLEVKNNPVIEYNNSITVTDAVIGNRVARFATSVPYVPNAADLYFFDRDKNDGLNTVFLLDNGSKVLTFAMPKGMSISRPATINGKVRQVRTPVTMMLFKGQNGVSRVSPLTITPSNP